MSGARYALGTARLQRISLWAQGNVHAAIQEEELCNELTNIYNVDILCGYSVEGSQGGMDSVIFQQICAEHAGGRESRY